MPKILTYTVTAAFAALIFPPAALAGELFGGVYKHNVNTPLTIGSPEGGVDLALGYRGRGIGKTGLQPYAFGALNTAGDSSYAAAGLSYKFGDKFFIRPGIGIAIHDGPADDFNRTDRIAFGSRVLFEPELGIGARISNRATLEASWVHMSHAQLFGHQNPGIDNIGARLSLAL
jgi:hypothetical protein